MGGRSAVCALKSYIQSILKHTWQQCYHIGAGHRRLGRKDYPIPSLDHLCLKFSICIGSLYCSRQPFIITGFKNHLHDLVLGRHRELKITADIVELQLSLGFERRGIGNCHTGFRIHNCGIHPLR